jgi:hypothetical protein
MFQLKVFMFPILYMYRLFTRKIGEKILNILYTVCVVVIAEVYHRILKFCSCVSNYYHFPTT